MPWNNTSDPYKIWISEIILQQTQVAQGLPYYQAFVRRFPNVKKLAKASEDEVLRLWQGLGYNSRARNMHATARVIVKDFDGVFPSNYAQIRALKGIGEYTAAAIASFAFQHPTPVLDSNVIRVLCRIEGISEDPAKRATRTRLYALLDKMIKEADPGQFNQAMMNFGALQCKARRPDCSSCVLSRHCVAFRSGLVEELPMRMKKMKRKVRFFHYFMIRNKSGLVIHQRTFKDIWQQMYDFPMLETSSSRMPSRVMREQFISQFGIRSPLIMHRLRSISQTLTHQEINCVFYDIETSRISKQKLPADYRFEDLRNLNNFAFPKVIRACLSDYSLHLLKLPQGS